MMINIIQTMETKIRNQEASKRLKNLWSVVRQKIGMVPGSTGSKTTMTKTGNLHGILPIAKKLSSTTATTNGVLTSNTPSTGQTMEHLLLGIHQSGWIQMVTCGTQEEASSDQYPTKLSRSSMTGTG